MAQQTDDRPDEETRNPGQTDYENKFGFRPDGSRDLQDLESKASEQSAQQAAPAKEREASATPGAAWATNTSKAGAATKGPGGIRAGAVNQAINVARGKGGIIGVVVGLFMLVLMIIIPNLLSFEVPSLMNLLNRFRGAAVERISDSFGRKINNQVMASAFGKKRGAVDYRDNSPLARILETEGLEERFREVGIEVEDAGDRGVTIRFRGQEIGTGRTPSDIDNLIRNAPDSVSGPLNDALSRAVSVKAWSKRIAANWIKAKFDIKRYGVQEKEPEEEEEGRKEDRETRERRRVQATREAQLRQDFDKFLSVSFNTFNCFMGEGGADCDPTDVNRDKEQERAEGADEEARRGQEAVRDTIEESADELVDEAPETNTSGRNSSNMIEKLTGKLAGIAGTKAIPYIGWADLAATIIVRIDQIARNDSIVKISAQAKGQLSGYMFGSFSGMGDQFKDAGMSAAYMGILANQMNGAEQSTAFQYASGNGIKGEQMPELFKLNLTNPDGVINGVQQILDNTSTTILITNPILYGTAYAWYYTIGWALRAGGDAVGGLAFSAVCKVQDIRNGIIEFFGGGGFIDFVREQNYLIADCDDLEETMTEILKTILPKLLPLLGLGFDPLVSGPLLFNILDMGGNFSFNQFCQESGCRKLTPEQASIQQSNALAAQKEEFMNQPLSERLFSRDTHYSAVNQLAFAMPSGLGDSVTSSLGSIFKLPQIAASQLSTTASASTLEAGGVPYKNLYGMDEYGATEADLNKDLPEQFFNGEECPELKEDGSEFNDCKYAEVMTDTYIAGITGDDGSIGGADPSEQPGEINLADLYKSSEDIACASGTEDRGVHDGYYQKKKIRIRICEVPDFPSQASESQGQYGFSNAQGGLLINSRISAVIQRMTQAMKEDGISPQASSGFRTHAHQQALYNKYLQGTGNLAAEPGTSNHQMGVAIDIPGATQAWFRENGAEYGFKALVSGEPWHWSPTGK